MQPIKQIVPKEQVQTTLQKSSKKTLTRTEKGYEMSAYSDGCSEMGITKAVVKIQTAFPTLETSFYKILSQRVMELQISDKRFMDSVNHVIDTCMYPTPVIANFISYDKSVTLLDYRQMVNMNNDLHGKGFDYYHKVDVGQGDMVLYASKVDIHKYGLTVVEFKKEK